MHIADIKVPRNWTKLEDLVELGRDVFEVKQDETYYIHNNSSYTLYVVEAAAEPAADVVGERIYAGRSAGYVKANGDLYVASKLPVVYPYPETIAITFCNDVVADNAIVIGDYTPAKDVKGAYVYKGSVATKADLPTEGEAIGDVYNVNEDGMNYAWTGTEWDQLGATIKVDLTPYAKKEDVDAALALKADKEKVTEDLATKAEAADLVNLEVEVDAINEAKADKTEVAALGTKADNLDQIKANKVDVDSALATKADKAEIPVIPENVSTFKNDAGYLTEHQDLSDYAKKEELPSVPTKVSELENDAGYISAIAEEYVTETELEAKGYLTEHQDISALATKAEVEVVAKDLDTLEAKAVEYTDIADAENLNRKAIVLENHDVLLGKTTEGATEVLAMMSKYNVADFGNTHVHCNLNTAQIVTVNDKQAVATDQLLANFLIAGDNMTVTQKDMKDPATNFEFKAYEFKAEVPEVDLAPYALKTDIPAVPTEVSAFNNDAGYLTEHQDISALATKQEVAAAEDQVNEVGASVTSLISRLDVLENKVADINKTNIEPVAAEAGTAVNVSDNTKDLIVTGVVDTAAKIEGKTVTLNNLEATARVQVAAAGDVDIKSSTIIGDFPKADGNTIVTVADSQYVTIKDTVIDATAYNAIEIGLTADTLPKGILFDNCKFMGDFTNNAIIVFGTQENAVININNCTFEKVSNVLRLSNKTNTNCTVNITNCKCDAWDARPQYAGLILCEDYTSKTSAEVEANNLFGDGKIAINISNFTLPSGEKLKAPADVAEICGSQNENQILYVYADANKEVTAYDAAKYPMIAIS